MKNYTAWKFTAAIFSGQILLSAAWLACLAYPCQLLWNGALGPACHFDHVDYWRTLGILLFWYLLKLAEQGVELRAKQNRD